MVSQSRSITLYWYSQSNVLGEEGSNERRKKRKRPFLYQRMPRCVEPDAEEIGKSHDQSNMPQLVLKWIQKRLPGQLA